MRDQLLQGLADNAETIRYCQVVESFCLSFFSTSLTSCLNLNITCFYINTLALVINRCEGIYCKLPGIFARIFN